MVVEKEEDCNNVSRRRRWWRKGGGKNNGGTPNYSSNSFVDITNTYLPPPFMVPCPQTMVSTALVAQRTI